jgi:hypothetical protein
MNFSPTLYSHNFQKQLNYSSFKNNETRFTRPFTRPCTQSSLLHLLRYLRKSLLFLTRTRTRKSHQVLVWSHRPNSRRSLCWNHPAWCQQKIDAPRSQQQSRNQRRLRKQHLLHIHRRQVQVHLTRFLHSRQSPPHGTGQKVWNLRTPHQADRSRRKPERNLKKLTIRRTKTNHPFWNHRWSRKHHQVLCSWKTYRDHLGHCWSIVPPQVHARQKRKRLHASMILWLIWCNFNHFNWYFGWLMYRMSEENTFQKLMSCIT